ncbi:hypothetical protein MIND_00353800 [Mycena indigotica]|uniref:Uncharacterized protein n=1 Tax=Mycena indigotica TaxID=2126181 RepID=A0A8H6WET8_9AGAR|nr:uncharacterized protein MIND_00353800 [Mycena indigotica]KAF7309819.1 hypothetical protein MIND_00353800 [Mycena indigotica]
MALFRTNSPVGYSSFFISGLLSPPSSSPASVNSRDSFDFGSRRGSLPTDSYRMSGAYEDDEASMFYFTLQPRRDSNEYRSFLSLDLAESLSLRSRSMKRKSSSAHRLPRSSRDSFLFTDRQIPDSPNLLPPPSPVGLSPTSRSIPSAKPVPAAILPDTPSFSRTKVTPHALKTALAPQRKPSVLSNATRASATTSTVSTRYRRKRRDKALDCLEGRRPSPPFAATENFMSLSDDEEDDEQVQHHSGAVPIMDQDLDTLLSDDQLIRLIARLEDGDLRTAPSPPSTPHSRESSSHSSKPRHKSALGLKSFMDFHNEDDTSGWSWRGVVEVAS